MAGFLTNSGLSKLAVATPLTPMTVKYMAFDAGQGTPTPSMSALFNEVYRTEIPNPVKDPDNPKNLTFSGFVPTTVGGWTIYGIGLFDSLNVLVAYLQLAEPVLKSDPSSALKMSWEQDFIIALANAGKTDLIITDSVQFRHNAITHRNLPDSHPISAITGLQPKLDNIQGSLDNNNTSINLDRKYKKITANYTVLNDDGGLIEIDASAGNITITMAKSTAHIAKEISFVRSDTTSNTVTINPASGDNFRTEGTTYALIVVKPNEVMEAKAGINYWAGIRSSATVLSTSSGFLRVIDKGIDIGQPILKSEVVNNLTSTVIDNPLSAAQGKALNDKMIGVGQSYQDVTSSREFGVLFTNDTNRPITVIICVKDQTGINPFSITVGGIVIIAINDMPEWGSAFTFIVPAGATYRADGNIKSKWVELR